MNLKRYSEEAWRTCPFLDENLMHMVLGLVTESGELADAMKRNLAYGQDLDVVNLKEEVGDLMWYIINLCRFLNTDLEDILDMNIAKLRVRYPEKFTEEAAINRDVDKERVTLEGSIEEWE